jgi:hypothetical protein
VSIHQAQGVTYSERYLKRLADRTFLSLWSYPRIYRDQGRVGRSGDGKEICDLLVVFGNHILIFSDKDCIFPNTGNLELDWQRWYGRAVKKAAEQVWGAERWITNHPDRVFLDRVCTQPFPFDIPAPSSAQVHRIVVAHGASERCRRELGGRGSLMIFPDIIGDMHIAPISKGGRPFAIGIVDPSRGYVHILDDTTLDILMNTLDTITEFVGYLSDKEAFIRSGYLGGATGEEELLAFYLSEINERGQHCFSRPARIDKVFVDDGHWEHFSENPQRARQREANEVSYAWDTLIEKTSKNAIADKLYYVTDKDFKTQDKILKWLAREPRTRRRMLGGSLVEMITSTPPNTRATRIIEPSNPGDPYFVFLVMPPFENTPAPDYRTYREVRRELLTAYCMATKLRYPAAVDIVGIASESGIWGEKAEDIFYFDARQWTDEHQSEAQSLQQDLGLFRKATEFRAKVKEYPDEALLLGTGDAPRSKPGPNPRNKPCPCGSGRKYKRCCGR